MKIGKILISGIVLSTFVLVSIKGAKAAGLIVQPFGGRIIAVPSQIATSLNAVCPGLSFDIVPLFGGVPPVIPLYALGPYVILNYPGVVMPSKLIIPGRIIKGVSYLTPTLCVNVETGIPVPGYSVFVYGTAGI